jgi:iron-sulfur cluster assembly protein
VSVLNISHAAADHIKKLCASKDGEHLVIAVKTSGCSGNQYDLSFTNELGPGYEKVEQHGASIYVEPKSLLVMFGMSIDWVEDKFGKRFEFSNPNEAGRCGCGLSFHT